MTADLMTDAQLAERLGKGKAFVQTRCRAGDWPHLRVGRSYRFTEEHYSDIVARLEKAPTAAARAGASWGRRRRGT